MIFELSSDGQIELPRALRDVIEDVEAGTRLEVGLRVYGQTQPVPAATQHALVQIAREALFNVVRHAEAHHAWVTLRWRPQVVSLAVADDGSGNHRKLQHHLFISQPNGDHLGLTGIAERVRGTGRRRLVRAPARGRREAEGRGAARRVGWPRLSRLPRPACCWSTTTRSSAAGCARSSSSSPTSPWWPRPAAGAMRLQALDRARPDVIVLDLKLSSEHDTEGLDLCSEIVRRRPQSNVVILSTFLNEHLLNQSLRRGAKAYVLKEVDVVELVRIIRAVSPRGVRVRRTQRRDDEGARGRRAPRWRRRTSPTASARSPS